MCGDLACSDRTTATPCMSANRAESYLPFGCIPAVGLPHGTHLHHVTALYPSIKMTSAFIKAQGFIDMV